VLYSEPQVVTRRSSHLDLIENFERFKILPAARRLEASAYPSTSSVSASGKSDSPKGLAVVSGGDARYDTLISANSVMTFQLHWPECREPGTAAQILLEDNGSVRSLFEKTLSVCFSSANSIEEKAELLDLKPMAGIRGTLVFRLLPPPGSHGLQRVVFQDLKLQERPQTPAADSKRLH
jgi:hypothetical protein